MSMPSGGPVSATLYETDNSGNSVVFGFNPKKIAISHGATRGPVKSGKSSGANAKQPHNTTGSTGGGGGGGDDGAVPLVHADQVTDVGATTITLSELLFDGDGTVDDCATILDWSYPKAAQGSNVPALTPLTFSWGGPPIDWSVTILKVDLVYTRFNSSGTPIRATANVTLQTLPDLPSGTNPSSGGIPGRRSHILVAGENLQHLATANYGKPGAWRALAAANGIEDPLAVRPGMVVYLPAAAELADGRQR